MSSSTSTAAASRCTTSVRASAPSWMEEVMRPLAQELARVSGLEASVGGPMGIGTMMFVSLRDLNGETQEYLCFTPHIDGDEFELLLVNQHSDNGRYTPGTVGHANNLHREGVRLQPNLTPQAILDLHKSFAPVPENSPVHVS